MSVGTSGLLVRVDTSALENRLNDVTDVCEGQVRDLRHRVEDCTADVRAVAADVAAIQRFLLSYHNREMSTVLSSGEVSSSGGSAPTADSVDQCATSSLPSTSTENILKMVTLARRLLADNDALRASLDKSTAALESYSATQAGLQQEVVRLRDLTTRQTTQLQTLSDWLGTSGLPLNDNNAAVGIGVMSEELEHPDGTHSPPSGATSQSTEAVLSRSPLLLSFRRFLLRDLTERLTSVVDQQSKEFHDSVAHLEGRIQSGQCVVTGGDPQQSGESNGDLLETVRTLSKRVNEVEQCTVKREEFTSLMRSKADSLLLPVKADSAAVSEMERRLATRCANLEERCAYADAERAEFRAILRSLIAVQTSAAAAGASHRSDRTSPPPAPSTSNGSAAAGGPQRGAVLRDVLPALPGSGANGAWMTGAATSSAAAQKPQSFHVSRGAASTSSTSTSPSPPPPPPPPAQQQQQQQLYRVVGTSHGIGIHGLRAAATASGSSGDGASSREAEPAAAVTAGARRNPARPQSTLVKGNDESALVIGMTASQGDYANYVSQQLNRKQINSLPTLPYERMTNWH
jgi:hypothetical protein